MDERTANKMVIYGHDENEWKQALLADVDADQLPTCYGGTNETNVVSRRKFFLKSYFF